MAVQKISAGLWDKMQKQEAAPVIVVFADRVGDTIPETARPVLEAPEHEAIEARIALFAKSAMAVQTRNMPAIMEARPTRRERGVKGLELFDSYQFENPQQLPLTNTMLLPATPKMVQRLADQDDVLCIVENKAECLDRPVKALGGHEPSSREQKAGMTWGLAALGVEELWDKGYGGEGILIGHLDTGVCADHLDLAGQVADFRVFTPFGEEIRAEPSYDSDDQAHGTHTAGTMVGGDSSGVAIGVAPGARLASGLVLPDGAGTTWQIMRGMEWLIRQKVHVMNMSLGGWGFNPGYANLTRKLLQFGIFPAFSIGNAGLGVTSSPANHETACGVGAIDRHEEVAPFSGGGTFTWLKNGQVRHDVKPDVVAPGVDVYSAIRVLSQTHPYQWGKMSGTSMAAPHVSGIVALLRQAAPDVSARDIMAAIHNTARHPGGTGLRDNRYGWGIIQPLEALEECLADPSNH